MPLSTIWLQTWWIFIGLGMLGWLFSLRHNRVNNVDTIWSMFFLMAALWVIMPAPQISPRQWLLLVLLAVWAVRLSLFLSVRNWGEQEDWRYAAMRNKRGASFKWRSIYVVYLLQALIAMVIFAGLLPGLVTVAPISLREWLAAGVAVLAIGIEALADWQLYRFKATKNNSGQVLQAGLWAYTRHPNYFAESLFWWSLFALSVQLDTLWTALSPIIMTFLLLRVSGVSMMEKGRTGQNPAYQHYRQLVPAFWPRFSKVGSQSASQSQDQDNSL